jgi:sterol 3beta-glucosyltransferase
MKTIILTIGSRGDVQPYIALAMGLQEAGIQVTVATHPMMRSLVESHGVSFTPISPQVFPPHPLWEPRHRMTGYWFTPEVKEWRPPADLLAFLEAGEPPVVVSLGAMAISGEDSLEAAQITLESFREAGGRAIIQGWDEAMPKLEAPETIFHAGSVPHSWLLERAAAIVHHGGFGTTASGLRAGIPSIVIPHIIDQFIWGQKVFELGVGPKPISRSKLTSSSLAEALQKATQDEEMGRKAACLGEQIRKEKGLEQAVRLVADAARKLNPRYK